MQKRKKLIIISGLSGAGKSQVLNILEDSEYFCVDNLPIELLDKFIYLVKHTKRNKFALSIDVRSTENIEKLSKIFEEYFTKDTKNLEVIKIFLEAQTEVLVERFSETRRKHPLEGELLEAIKKEKKMLDRIKKLSDFIIDTSNLTISELKNKVLEIIEKRNYGHLNINIISFGYKFGIPLNADIVIDTRFLPNPNYVNKLKIFTGLSKKVKLYILRSSITENFVKILEEFFSFLLPQILKEGKNYLTIAFGCTGGRHRSVVIAEYFYKYLSEIKKSKKYKFKISILHRDL